MKTLKFKDFKAGWILEGTKTATMRLFDDKDLKVGDELGLINSDNGEIFAQAIITEVIFKKIEDISETDLDGHEKWNNKTEMLESLRRYYGDRVNEDTEVKIIRFKLKQMPILYIMVGVGFSGKSTLAKKIAEHLEIPIVSQDGLFFEKEKELNIDQDNDEQWRMLLDMCKQRIKEFMLSGKSVVFDNVNLRRSHRDELRKIADEAGGKAVVIYLDTSEEMLNKRQSNNKATGERHDVKQEYLDDAKAQLEIPGSNEDTYIFTPETDLNIFLGKLSK